MRVMIIMDDDKSCETTFGSYVFLSPLDFYDFSAGRDIENNNFITCIIFFNKIAIGTLTLHFAII